MLDLSRLKLPSPHPIWTEAGSNPVSTTKATVVTWLLMNVYKTGERLHKMKKVKTPKCVLCSDPLESQLHFALQCPTLQEIRSQYMGKFIEACPLIEKCQSDQKLLFLALLDPYSSYLPEDLRESWKNKELAYELSRNYFFALHKKREKVMETSINEQNQPENEDVTQIIINVYQNI